MGWGVLIKPKKFLFGSQNGKTYKYTSKEKEIFLELGDLIVDEYWGAKVKHPFYDSASIDVKSNNYSTLLNNEKLRLKNLLKPEDVLEVNFKQPYLESNPDTLEKLVVLEVQGETFKTFVLDNNAIEFKGLLSITDAYDELLFEFDEFIYIFNTPLFNRNKQEWRTVSYPVYTLTSSIPNYDRIKRLILLGSKLKVKLKPTAVVLDNGDIIK